MSAEHENLWAAYRHLHQTIEALADVVSTLATSGDLAQASSGVVAAMELVEQAQDRIVMEIPGAVIALMDGGS